MNEGEHRAASALHRSSGDNEERVP